MGVCDVCGGPPWHMPTGQETKTEGQAWMACVEHLRQQLADRDRELAAIAIQHEGACAAAGELQARIDRAIAIGRDWCNQAADRGLLPVIEDMCAALEGKEDDETPT